MCAGIRILSSGLPWERLPEPKILLPEGPDRDPAKPPPVGRLIRPVDERVHVLVVEDRKPVRVSEEQARQPDVDVLRRDGNRVVVSAFEAELRRMVELVVHRDGFASRVGLLHVGGQREHLELIVPCAVRAADPAVLRDGAVRERDIKALVWLVGPCIAHAEKLTHGPVVALVSRLAAGESTDARGEAERVGRAGIDAHRASPDPHLDGVHRGIGPKVGCSCLADALAVASEFSASVPELHGLRVVQEVAAQPDSVGHRLAGDRQRSVGVKEVVALVDASPAQKTGHAQHVADELSRPVGHLRIVGRELRLQPVRERLELLVRFLRECYDLRLLRILVVQEVYYQTLVGAVDAVGHGLAPVSSASHAGDRHAVEEPCGEASSAEGRVAEDRGDDVRLRHQEDGERRVHDAFAVPADSVDADRVSRVAFQHDVDVHVPRVDAGQGVEDPALTGDQGGVSVVACDDGDELLGCDVVHVELQRVCLLEVGDLLRDALQFLRVGGAFCDLLLEGLLPALQHALLHASGLDRSSVGLVVFDLVVVDWLQHEMQDR